MTFEDPPVVTGTAGFLQAALDLSDTALSRASQHASHASIARISRARPAGHIFSLSIVRQARRDTVAKVVVVQTPFH